MSSTTVLHQTKILSWSRTKRLNKFHSTQKKLSTYSISVIDISGRIDIVVTDRTLCLISSSSYNSFNSGIMGIMNSFLQTSLCLVWIISAARFIFFRIIRTEPTTCVSKHYLTRNLHRGRKWLQVDCYKYVVETSSQWSGQIFRLDSIQKLFLVNISA